MRCSCLIGSLKRHKGTLVRKFMIFMYCILPINYYTLSESHLCRSSVASRQLKTNAKQAATPPILKLNQPKSTDEEGGKVADQKMYTTESKCGKSFNSSFPCVLLSSNMLSKILLPVDTTALAAPMGIVVPFRLGPGAIGAR